MKSILTFAILGMIGIAILKVFLAIKRKQESESTPDDGPPASFYKKSPLTEIEQILYYRLVSALPDYVVLAQVQVSRIVGMKQFSQGWFNKISRKSVDFLICQKNFSILAAIELDDSSHDTEERQAKDADKDAALKGAGIRMIRCRASDLPTTDAIQKMMHALNPLVR